MNDKKIKQWVSDFELLENVIKLNTAQARFLFQKIVAENWQEGMESLSFSYGYHLLTGRHGAWLYSDGQSFIVVCIHPNRHKQILIYPPIGKTASRLLNSFFKEIPIPPGKAQMARVQSRNGYSLALSKRITNHSEMEYAHVNDEHVLDWLYPVQIFSTAKATEKSGKDLHSVRKECRKLDLNSIEFLPFQGTENHILNVVGHKYASVFLDKNKNFALTYEELMASMVEVMRLCSKNQDIFNMRVTWYKGKPEGYVVWERLSTRTANALWFLYNREIRGLSYTQMVKTCEHLKNEGVEIVNFGGSETEGLNMFKRKFKPVQTIPLKSIDLEFRQMNYMKEPNETISTETNKMHWPDYIGRN